MSRPSRRPGEDHSSFQSSRSPQDQSIIRDRQAPHHDPTASGMSSFQNARIGGDVKNNQFNTAGGNLTVHNTMTNNLVSTILLPYVAPGAIFDSAERYSAGRCHPGTRQRMIDQVKKWIQGTNRDNSILWIYGPAGAGKSSLMQSICELLGDLDPKTHGASFFFARGHPDRGNGTKLFVTLAHQLTVQFPSVYAKISDALHHDSTLPTKSMSVQLQSLIIDPLICCQESPSPTPILLIDGLDECDTDNNQGLDTQCQIINLISQSLAKDNVPFRLILASRPEYWIWELFETPPLSDITLGLSLRDDVDADEDIRRLLTESFEKIRLKKSRIMRSVALPWPPYYIINRFVEEASGQYIYPSTILKFVGDHPYKSPEEQLRIITTPGPHRATAYSELDRLYATIISAHPEWETMKRVLGGLLINVNLAVIRVFLEVRQSEVTLVLDALRSLIDIVPPSLDSEYEELLFPIFGPSFEDEQISFCHSSFREFLLDNARSGTYHIDIKAVQSKVVSAFFGVIQRNLDGNYEIEPYISCDVDILEYRRMMDMIIQRVDSYLDGLHWQALFPLVHDMVGTFRRFDPGRRMNHPACFMRDMDFLSAFLRKFDPKFNQRILNLDPQHNVSSSYIATVSQLQNLTSMARKVGIRLLSLCEGFSITHTLYLIRYLQSQTRLGVRIYCLFKIPGSSINDKLSTILQHRHIINIAYLPMEILGLPVASNPCRVLCMSLVNLGETSELEGPRPEFDDGRLYWPIWTENGTVVDLQVEVDQKIGKGWLFHTEWTNQHVSLACEFLKIIINNPSNGLERLDIYSGHYNEDIFNVKGTILSDFFNHDRGISDIHGEDYFGNKCYLSFLDVMVDSDLKAWLALFPSSPYVWDKFNTVLTPVLCWFNRHLANPKTAKLIEDHDASFPFKMTMAMNTIFQRCFVPLFTTPYFSRLVVTLGYESIEIKVSPSSYSEEKIDHCPLEHISSQAFRNIHNEIFERGPHAGGNQSFIPRSEWHPHLSAYLFNICVKYLRLKIQSQTNSAFRGDNHNHEFSEIFPCIVQCLPYAQTTPQNLDALRAIKHLSRQIDVRSEILWAPSGFCSGAMEFLKRYERYAPSSEELSDFELWIRGITEVSLDDWDNFVQRGIKKNDKH